MAIPLQLNINLKANNHDCDDDPELSLPNNATSAAIPPSLCGIPLKTLSYVVFVISDHGLTPLAR